MLLFPKVSNFSTLNFFVRAEKRFREKKPTIYMEVERFTSKDNFETILQQFSLQYFHPFLDFYAESIVNC